MQPSGRKYSYRVCEEHYQQHSQPPRGHAENDHRTDRCALVENAAGLLRLFETQPDTDYDIDEYRHRKEKQSVGNSFRNYSPDTSASICRSYQGRVAKIESQSIPGAPYNSLAHRSIEPVKRVKLGLSNHYIVLHLLCARICHTHRFASYLLLYLGSKGLFHNSVEESREDKDQDRIH